jgi:hypothetical protein
MLKKLILATALCAVTAMPAHAQLTEGSPDCSLSVLSPTYSQCWGSFSGNNTGAFTATSLTYLNSLGYGNWTDGGTTNANLVQGPFSLFTGASSGTLTFLAAPTQPFFLALKAGNRFSFFYFDQGLPINAISYTTNGVDVNGRNAVPAGLSHATYYTQGGFTPPNNGTPPITTVPEPSTYLLMAAGLAGLAVASRRRRRQ